LAFEVAETEVGAPGVVAGVTETDAEEAVPVPLALVAATRKTYDVPFVKPVTVAEVLVLAVCANVDHVSPLLDEY
jgi:hypothetical protein